MCQTIIIEQIFDLVANVIVHNELIQTKTFDQSTLSYKVILATLIFSVSIPVCL